MSAAEMACCIQLCVVVTTLQAVFSGAKCHLAISCGFFVVATPGSQTNSQNLTTWPQRMLMEEIRFNSRNLRQWRMASSTWFGETSRQSQAEPAKQQHTGISPRTRSRTLLHAVLVKEQFYRICYQQQTPERWYLRVSVYF